MTMGLRTTRAELELLCTIAREGSLAGAARALELAPPQVSKRLQALETRLGLRLLQRTTRRLRLTPEGERFVAGAQPLLDGFSALEQALAERRDEASGSLRIASSFGFGRQCLAPLLAEFQRRHPAIRIHLQLADQLPDLAGGDIDAAVWLWQPTGAALRSLRLARNRRVVVGAPAYLRQAGVPETPADLARQRCLVVHEHAGVPAQWRLQPLPAAGRRPRAEDAVSVRVSGPLASNHGEVVRDWALAGHGLMLRSLWDVHEHLRCGELQPVLPGWAMLDADVHWVLPPRDPLQAPPRRLRLLQDFLVEAFAAVPWADAVSAAGAAPGAACAPPATRRRR